MSISLVLISLALAGVALAAWVIFREYPRSAVATARNTLFSLRDELFHLGRAGVIPFDSAGYRYNRRMINGMIRYAHDVTAMQLIWILIFRSESSKQYTHLVRTESSLAMSALPKRGRAEVDRIMRHATDAIFQLVITRSVAMSTFFAALLVALKLWEICHQAGGRIRHSLMTVVAQEEDRSSVEHAIEEILDHRPMKGFRPIIRAEAARYSPPAVDRGLCLA